MKKLWIYRGLSASGKSTDARGYVRENLAERIRINRDTLRDMAHGGAFVKGVTEQHIISARNSLIQTYLKAGMEVLVDDTNLSRRNVVDLIKLAQKHGAEWELKDFTHVDVDECIRRDVKRVDAVGSAVILDQYHRYLKGKKPLDLSEFLTAPAIFTAYVPDTSLPLAAIVDIDGTVAKMNGRSPYDYTQVSSDVPNKSVIETVWALHDNGIQPLFTSGRPDSCYDDTFDWLNRKVIANPTIFMRTAGDTRADYIVKAELFDKYIRHNYYVKLALDDRNQVVDMWRSLGLTCLQVDYGDF